MWWAHLETSNFTFDAFGESQYGAMMEMRRGWVKHAKATKATLAWEEVGLDVQLTCIALGGCWRDREKLT